MKTCSEPGCDYPVWGGGYCKYHQYKRKDIKPKSTSRPTHHVDICNEWGFSREVDMYKDIWTTRDKESALTGQPLARFCYTEMWYNCFSHVLAKAQNRYPLFRLYPKNIWLMTPDEHHLYDNGSKDQRDEYARECAAKGFPCRWDDLYEYADMLRKEYKEFKILYKFNE